MHLGLHLDYRADVSNTRSVIAVLLLAVFFLAPGVLLLRAGWPWTGWIAVLVGLWLACGAFAAWLRDRRRRLDYRD